MELNDKLIDLKEYLQKLKRVAVAYSSGVDSTFLLDFARQCLGYENVVAITASLNSVPRRELKEADDFCKAKNIKHINVELDELTIEGFAQNPKNRCYICKKSIFSKLIEVAKENGLEFVLEGSNTDDMLDYRPGMQAIKELGVLSPLKECNMSKADIRDASKQRNLDTWDKPSFACLSSRFAYGDTITKEKLRMVDGAEQYLYELGFKQYRVRIHNNENMIARIEVMPDDFARLIEDTLREKVYNKFKEIGFSYVSLDLKGYRTGSMNEVISNK